MGFFSNQLQSVIEWEEFRSDVIFWKYKSKEIKKDSRLIIKPGQDAIFFKDGKVEGIFVEEGSYEVESDIIPFLTTLKSFKFGFNTPLRAEILFVNTKEFTEKWGTSNPINIRTENLPGGMPIRAHGTFSFKVSDYGLLIENIAGVKQIYTTGDIKERVSSNLNQLLMKWISKEGRDMFDLQASASEISKGIREDLDMEIMKIGLTITAFNIESFSYPEEISRMQQKAAGQSMIGDMDKYTRVAMADSMEKSGGASMAGNMAQMQVGMMMGKEIADSMNKQTSTGNPSSSIKPNFCPNCGARTEGANFCSNCGQKL